MALPVSGNFTTRLSVGVISPPMGGSVDCVEEVHLPADGGVREAHRVVHGRHPQSPGLRGGTIYRMVAANRPWTWQFA